MCFLKRVFEIESAVVKTSVLGCRCKTYPSHLIRETPSYHSVPWQELRNFLSHLENKEKCKLCDQQLTSKGEQGCCQRDKKSILFQGPLIIWFCSKICLWHQFQWKVGNFREEGYRLDPFWGNYKGGEVCLKYFSMPLWGLLSFFTPLFPLLPFSSVWSPLTLPWLQTVMLQCLL